MVSLLQFSLPKPVTIKATSSLPAITTTTTTATTLSIPDTLEGKLTRKGIKFTETNKVPTVELTVRNGSSVRVEIPNAHVTSYKPKVYWKDDGFEEVLYTIPPPAPPSNGASASASATAKGGIGLVINEVSENGVSQLLSSSEWSVKDVDSDSIDALQVELSSSSGPLDITYVVSLYPLSMATAVIVKNNSLKPVTLTSAILTHLKFKKRHKSGIQGLMGCKYCLHPPLSSPFQILSPIEAMKPDEPGFFSFGSEPVGKPGSWSVQDVPFTILKHKLSRVYAAPPEERLAGVYRTPPSKYEALDQGRELFFRIIRIGFEDIHLSAPGSYSQKYGDEYFICTGPAAMLVPVVLEPGEDWRGAQVIEHDNL